MHSQLSFRWLPVIEGPQNFLPLAAIFKRQSLECIFEVKVFVHLCKKMSVMWDVLPWGKLVCIRLRNRFPSLEFCCRKTWAVRWPSSETSSSGCWSTCRPPKAGWILGLRLTSSSLSDWTFSLYLTCIFCSFFKLSIVSAKTKIPLCFHFSVRIENIRRYIISEKEPSTETNKPIIWIIIYYYYYSMKKLWTVCDTKKWSNEK